MAKEKFERTKPHVNIGAIGHIGHGKNTLTAVVTKLAGLKGNAEFVLFDEIVVFLNNCDMVRDTEKPFLMPIEDVFSISGRGTVVAGRVERGIVRTGEEIGWKKNSGSLFERVGVPLVSVLSAKLSNKCQGVYCG